MYNIRTRCYLKLFRLPACSLISPWERWHTEVPTWNTHFLQTHIHLLRKDCCHLCRLGFLLFCFPVSRDEVQLTIIFRFDLARPGKGSYSPWWWDFWGPLFFKHFCSSKGSLAIAQYVNCAPSRRVTCVHINNTNVLNGFENCFICPYMNEVTTVCRGHS